EVVANLGAHQLIEDYVVDFCCLLGITPQPYLEASVLVVLACPRVSSRRSAPLCFATSDVRRAPALWRLGSANPEVPFIKLLLVGGDRCCVTQFPPRRCLDWFAPTTTPAPELAVGLLF